MPTSSVGLCYPARRVSLADTLSLPRSPCCYIPYRSL